MGNDFTAWMPVYWRDLLAETAHFSPAQFGAYCLLIAAYWNSRGAISADPDRLRRIARMDAKEWAEASPVIIECFQESDGKWSHAALDEELAGAESRYRQRAAAGSKGGKARGKQNTIVAEASPSSSVKPCFGQSRTEPKHPQAQPQAKESPIGDSEGTQAPQCPTGSPRDSNDDLEIPNFLDRRSMKNGTRIVPDWQPNEAAVQFARGLELDANTVDNVVQQFRDYWTAKPGRDGIKSDWNATWRNWVRRHIDYNGSGPWPVDGGRRPQGNGQGPAGVLAAVRSLMPPAG